MSVAVTHHVPLIIALAASMHKGRAGCEMVSVCVYMWVYQGRVCTGMFLCTTGFPAKQRSPPTTCCTQQQPRLPTSKETGAAPTLPGQCSQAMTRIGSAMMTAFTKAFPACSPPKPGHRLKAVIPMAAQSTLMPTTFSWSVLSQPSRPRRSSERWWCLLLVWR